jgi:hypothetical protein
MSILDISIVGWVKDNFYDSLIKHRKKQTI